MSDNNSLNEKYGKFEPIEDELQEEISSIDQNDKKKKEKKVKEKKAKTPRKPKEPKPHKEKKEKNKKKKSKNDETALDVSENSVLETEEFQEFGVVSTDLYSEEVAAAPVSDDTAEENEEVSDSAAEIETTEAFDSCEHSEYEKDGEKTVPEHYETVVTEQSGRRAETQEFVFSDLPENKSKPKKDKIKKEKAPKEKKVKEPKEKKVRKPKEKNSEVKEKKPREKITRKDVQTIALSVIALILACTVGFFAYFESRSVEKKVELVAKSSFLGKVFPQYVLPPESTVNTSTTKQLADVQIAREGILTNLVQTDFPRIFYGVNSDYTVQYYQFSDNKITPVGYTDTINLKVDMGSGILNVKMDYVKNGDYVSGIGLFIASEDDETNYFYDLVVFKLTVLPLAYQKPGHALLLATTDKSAIDGGNVLWSESFDVNLNDGSMTRFLSVVNRTIDEKGAGVADFCILNQAGYTSSLQKVPFISSREYPIGSKMQDIFVKSGSREELLASDIYCKYLTMDGGKIIYLRRNTAGFDVIHNTGGEEKIVKTFVGFMDTSYMINDKYILSKNDGKLYNIVTGAEYSLVGYAMNAASFTVSGDGRYLVMMGTVKNALDYQIHVFDLTSGEYVKFQDKNYAPHGTLCFIDENKVLYTAVDPNQGYEYVIMDIVKAFS